MSRSISAWLFLAVALPGVASAGVQGTLKVGDKAAALTAACAVVPRYDMQGWGKPEVTVLLSDRELDCAAIADWVNAESGAFDQAVQRGDGSLVSVSFQPGLTLGRVSVYGVGYTLGNDTCDGCKAEAAYGGAGLRGSIKTGKPLMLNDTPVAFDLRFDLARPAAPARGDKLDAGSDPAKAYLAYLQAFAKGDYAALQKLMPEGKAEDRWGYYDDEAERRKEIQSEDKPKSAKFLEGWRTGASAYLIVEAASPLGTGDVKTLIGLGFDGTNWRVREERPDYGGTMLSSGN
jgi:hypothetical protein